MCGEGVEQRKRKGKKKEKEKEGLAHVAPNGQGQ